MLRYTYITCLVRVLGITNSLESVDRKGKRIVEWQEIEKSYSAKWA